MTDLEMAVFKQIGSRIRAARTEKKMSQAELAEKAHLCLPQISEVELGKVKMNLYTFIKIVEALQVSADSILRPDTPEMKSVFQGEFAELLSDCRRNRVHSQNRERVKSHDAHKERLLRFLTGQHLACFFFMRLSRLTRSFLYFFVGFRAISTQFYIFFISIFNPW